MSALRLTVFALALTQSCALRSAIMHASSKKAIAMRPTPIFCQQPTVASRRVAIVHCSEAALPFVSNFATRVRNVAVTIFKALLKAFHALVSALRQSKDEWPMLGGAGPHRKMGNMRQTGKMPPSIFAADSPAEEVDAMVIRS